MEWEKHCFTNSGPDRRLSDRLGGSVWWSPERRPVVTAGAAKPHQYAGTDSRCVCHPSLYEGQAERTCSPEDGQHIWSNLSDPDGWHSIPQSNESGVPDMGLVPPAWNYTHSHISPRTEQQGSRLGVQGSENICKVETERRIFPHDLLSPGTMQGGPVRNMTEQAVIQLHQLE